MTRQRELISRIIRQSGEHLTANRIYELARCEMPSIAIGTVYRNLRRMVEDGELMQVSVPDAPDRYDITVSRHSHLICERCGTMTDVKIGELKEQIETQNNVIVSRYQVAVWGLCPACTEKSRQEDL